MGACILQNGTVSFVCTSHWETNMTNQLHPLFQDILSQVQAVAHIPLRECYQCGYKFHTLDTYSRVFCCSECEAEHAGCDPRSVGPDYDEDYSERDRNGPL